MFVFAIRVIGELLTKISTRWLYNGSGERCQTSIDLTKDDGIINKLIELLYRFKVYRRYVFRTFTPVHGNYKSSSVLKLFLLIYTMAFLVFCGASFGPFCTDYWSGYGSSFLGW